VLLEEAKFGLLPVYTVSTALVRSVASLTAAQRDATYSRNLHTMNIFARELAPCPWPEAGEEGAETGCKSPKPSKRRLSPRSVAYRAQCQRPADAVDAADAAASADAQQPSAQLQSAESAAESSAASTVSTMRIDDLSDVRAAESRPSALATIPVELTRVHMVYSALSACLVPGHGESLKVRVSLEAIVDRCCEMFANLRGKSTAQLTQHVAWEVRDLVDRVHRDNREATLDVEYASVRDSVSLRRSSGLMLTQLGLKTVQGFVAHAVRRMRDDPTFSDTWFASSSAKQYARGVALKF